MTAIVSTLPRTTSADARADKLFFAQVREDATVEIEAFQGVLDGPIAVVSSGGCTALSLLGAGAHEVHAVDLNTTQNDLVELKCAALALLSHEDALGFLGAREMFDEERLAHYGRLWGALTPQARATWDQRPKDIAAGVLHAGVTEKFLRVVLAAVRRTVTRRDTFERILTAPDLEAQARVFRTEWDNARWRKLLAVLCHRRVFDSVYDEGFFASTGKRSFAEHFATVVEHGLTEIPASTNWFAHDLLAGSYGDTLPPYLREEGAAAVRAARGHLHLADASMETWLRTQEDGSLAGVALSNICEWLDAAGVSDLFTELARSLRPGGVVVLRNFVGWTEIPTAAEPYFEIDPDSAELARQDRSLMQYRVVVLRRSEVALAPPEVQIRELEAADTPEVAKLVRENPIQGATSYIVDRSPNWRGLHDRLPGSHSFLAESAEGEIAGVVGMLALEGRVGDDVVPTAYANGLVRRPGRRYAGTGARLVGAVLEEFERSEAQVLTWLANSDNPRMRRLAERSSPPGTITLARVGYTEVLPLRASVLPAGWRLERGHPEHPQEAIDLINSHYANHSLYPPLTLEGLEGALPGSSAADLRLLYDPTGELRAAALVGDPSLVTRVVPISLDRLSRTWERAVGGLRRLGAPLPEPPHEGEPVRTLHLRRMGWRDEEAGRLLVRALGIEVVEKGLHTLSYVADERDPLPRAHRLVFTYPGTIAALVKPDAATSAAELAAKPVFLDISLT